MIRRGDLFAMALVLGFGGGLFEGVLHMVLQRFMLENAWYPIIWIAAVFNGLVLAVLAGVLTLAAAFRSVRRGGPSLVVFPLIFVASLPCFGLLLKEWIHPAAILMLAVGMSVAATRAICQRTTRAFALARRTVPAVVVLTLLAFVGIEGGSWLQERILTWRLPVAGEAMPDILVLIVDTLRSDHLSSYGYSKTTSANLDRLAVEGVLFERAYSTSSWTLPAHVSLLTGLYPHQHGVEWLTSKHWGSTNYRLLPEILQDRGYRAAAFSANTFWVSREHGFGRGFLHFEDYFHSPQDMVLRTAYGRIAARLLWPLLGWRDNPSRKVAQETNRALLEWMGRDPDRPAFVMVNYFDVHDPYMPPEPFSGRGRPRGLVNSLLGTPETLTPDEWSGEVDAYDGAIRYVDAQIGELLKQLQGRNERELLVVVTSDHGEEFGEHSGSGHGHHLYREAIQVPLLFWRPGHIPAGRHVSTPVTIASIPATIMELIGLDASRNTAPSLRPLWGTVTPVGWPSPLLELARRPWEGERTPVRHGSMRSVVESTWHFIEHETFGTELYDLARDPSERRNLARDTEQQHRLDEFRDQLGRISGP